VTGLTMHKARDTVERRSSTDARRRQAVVDVVVNVVAKVRLVAGM